MIRQQLWKRLQQTEKAEASKRQRVVQIRTRPGETEEELDKLVERWQAGQPMERFGGVYDEDTLFIIRNVLV